ncbi:MAG: hypothetical protein SFV18_17635 [Bryobacteraceae bacterium]|nr:hypothetical protein [Bryobacteraceae bacterium]
MRNLRVKHSRKDEVDECIDRVYESVWQLFLMVLYVDDGEEYRNLVLGPAFADPYVLGFLEGYMEFAISDMGLTVFTDREAKDIVRTTMDRFRPQDNPSRLLLQVKDKSNPDHAPYAEGYARCVQFVLDEAALRSLAYTHPRAKLEGSRALNRFLARLKTYEIGLY